MKPVTLTQHELSALWGVDRTTLTQYQRDGMPYVDPGRGKANEYNQAAINWIAGWRYVRERNLPIRNPVVVMLLGFAIGGEPDYETKARQLAALMNITGKEFYKALGMAQGIRLRKAS